MAHFKAGVKSSNSAGTSLMLDCLLALKASQAAASSIRAVTPPCKRNDMSTPSFGESEGRQQDQQKDEQG